MDEQRGNGQRPYYGSGFPPVMVVTRCRNAITIPAMAKAEIKTKETDASVEKFLKGVADEQQREDAFTVLKMMQRATGDKPKMWGAAIIGFGNRVYKSPATGREVDWMKIGFSPRKAAITLYVLNGAASQAKLLEKLGKHKTGKGCLYIKRLADVDESVLEKLIAGACTKASK